MIDRNDIYEYVEDTYHGISVYDHSSYLRITNGSAAHALDIKFDNDTLSVKAERYGETYEGTHERTIDGLEDALHYGLGL